MYFRKNITGEQNFTDNPACRAGLCISEIQTGEQNFTDISD